MITCKVLGIHKNSWNIRLYVIKWLSLVFTNGPGDLGSDSKIVLDASLFNTQHYKVRNKGKENNPGKGVAPSPTPLCSSFWKVTFGSPLTTINLLDIYIYIYIYIYMSSWSIVACLNLKMHIHPHPYMHTYLQPHTNEILMAFCLYFVEFSIFVCIFVEFSIFVCILLNFQFLSVFCWIFNFCLYFVAFLIFNFLSIFLTAWRMLL